MSVILESQIGDDLINILEFHASPKGEPFSWSTCREFSVGERVRYESFFRDEQYENHPGLGWMVEVKAADGKLYAVSQTYLVTEECWEGLRVYFRTRQRKRPTKTQNAKAKLVSPRARGAKS